MSAHSPGTPSAGLDNEAVLLGVLLARPSVVLGLPVRAEHYQRPIHQVIHQAITEVADLHGTQAGVIHVAQALQRRTDVPNLMPALGNGVLLTDYLGWAELAGGQPAWLAERVVDAWRRRQVRGLGTRLAQLADSGADPGDVIEHAMSCFLGALDVVGEAHWDPPTPLAPRRVLPRFPIDTLPGWLADQVAAVATFTQTPPDLAGCLALAALAAAAGGRARVQIRPGWVEPVNLFTVVAMPPGSRKSAVFAAMTAPLLAAEQALAEQAAPAIIEADLAARTARRDAERHATAAANAPTPQARAEALALATDAALTAEQLTIPARPRLVADDITPETAATRLAEQGGRLAVLSAEGGIFTTIAGRYSGAPNLEVFLKGHAGDLLRVDRKTRPAEHVTHPALTLGLAVQPEVLADIAAMPGFRGRGLLARILYALPANTVGHRHIGAPAIPDTTTATYHHNLRALTLSLAPLDPPAALTLADDANQHMLALEAQLEPRLADGADLTHITDWAAKLNGAIARLAALIHLATHLRHGFDQPISTDTLQAAARLGHYYLAHALATFDLMHADPTVDAAHTILDWITRTHTPRFTRRQLFTAISRARFPKTTDLDAPLTLLENHGYLRRVPTPTPNRPGRPPAPTYDVHPHTLN
ncbi:MAG: DUF3987 domain-containing protein, partial [Thermoleophilaceae bacterium]